MTDKRYFWCLLCLWPLLAAGVIQAQSVINVKDPPYNATGDGSTDDTSAINSAISARNTAGPGMLYFPAGTYLINPTNISSISCTNVWICGESAGASVLKRTTGGGTGALLTNGTNALSAFEVSDLGFDLNLSADNSQGINVASSRRLRIENCRFYSSATYTNGDAHIHAVTVSDTPTVWVLRNRLEGCQVSVNNCADTGTNGKDRGAIIRDNYFADARAHAIVFKAASGTNPTSAAVIAGNIIRNIGVGNTSNSSAICIGREYSYDSAVAANDIQVVENQIVGQWGGNTRGIAGIPATESKGWVISKNILRNEATDRGSNTYGISITSGTGLKDLLIEGNVVKHLSNAGILVNGNLGGGRVLANHVEDARGIYLYGSSAGDDRVLVMGNVCVGNSTFGLYLLTGAGNLAARVSGNSLRNSYNDTYAAGLRLETSGSYTLTADVFQNELIDDRAAGSKTQNYGVRFVGTSGFSIRFFDNDFQGNNTAAASNTPASGITKRDNAGWP